MSLNRGSRIVPWAEANALLRAVLGPDVELPHDEYARVQLLEREDAEDMVFRFLASSRDWALLAYGELSPDFPLCLDFARIALALLCLGAAKAGLAVRPYFFRLHYTKPEGRGRHAINGVLLADGSVRFLEPQGLVWMDWPKDVLKLDRVRL